MGHRYQLTAKLEAAELFDLFRAQQSGSREVTVKLFSPKASDPAFGKLLIDSSRKFGALQHPSIIYSEEIGLVQERLCAVRASVDGFHLGTALSRLATKEVVLPFAVAMQITIEALQAIGAAHVAGLFHGAITPANILLSRDGVVFVTDFQEQWAMQRWPPLKGLANRGRQPYRAPEVAKGTEADAGADVYSAGAVLYELLTLQEVADARGGGVSTRREVLTPPSRIDRRINARVDPLILRSLEALKSRRYKNCLEMAESLKAFQEANGASAGRAEIARFVKELFPNEMGLASGEVPWKEPFTLETIVEGPQVPSQTFLDSTQQVPAHAFIEATQQVAAFPRNDLEGATVEAPPPEMHEAMHEATALDIDPAELQRAKGKESPSFESWDAPPGVLDPAVARALNPPKPVPSPVQPVYPIMPAYQAAPPASELPPVPRPPARAKAEAQAQPAARPAAAPMANASRRPVEPPKPAPPPKPDWHVVIPPPPPPPKVRTPLSWWFAAVLIALAAAGIAYLALKHRIDQLPRERPAAHRESRP